MRSKKLLLIVFSFTFFAITLRAQDDCENALFQANRLYKNGNIDDAIDRLETCVGDHMTDEERFESYKLLAACYSNNKDNDERDEYLKLMLRMKPNYLNKPHNDPKEISRAINQFKVEPQIRIGAVVGSHIHFPKVKESYSALNVNQQYIPTLGYQFGFLLDYHLFKQTSATFGVSIRGMSIQHEMSEADAWMKDYTELITFSQFNIGALQYVNLTKKMRGFAGLDLGIGIMNSAKVNVKTENVALGTIDQATKNVIEDRNKVNPNLTIKTGVSFDIDIALVSLDIGYSSYARKTIKSDIRTKDQDFIFRTQYINDDIVPKLLMFNIGFSIPLTYSISK
jgi:tetratricopeptide (TPR) repeat protein